MTQPRLGQPTSTAPRVRPWIAIAAVLLISLNLRGPIAAVSPVLGEMRTDLGMGPGEAGLLTALPVLSFAIASPAVLVLYRKFGIEVSVLGALLVMVAGTFLRSAPVSSALPALIGTAIIGLAITVGNVLVPVVIKRDVPQHSTMLTGLYTAGMCAGAALAAALTAPLAVPLGWRWALVSWVALVVFTVPFWIVLWRIHRKDSHAGGRRAHLAGLWKDRTAVSMTIFFGCQSLLYYALTAWIPTILMAPPEQGGIAATPGTAGLALSLFQLMGILGTLLIPVLVRIRPDQGWIGTAIGVTWIITLIGLAVAPSWWVLWGLIGGTCQGSGISFAYTLIVLRTRDDRSAAGLSGFMQSLGYLLGALGPVLGGLAFALTDDWRIALFGGLFFAIALGIFGTVAGAHRMVGDPTAGAEAG